MLLYAEKELFTLEIGQNSSFYCLLVENEEIFLLQFDFIHFKYDILVGVKEEILIEFTLEPFSNDSFKVLKFLKDNQVEVKGHWYVNLSQQEIADMNHMSKLKTNRILRELREGNFVIPYQNKCGKYEIPEQGHKVLRLMLKNNA